jgi:SOS-response transcriptional repressor LexA
MTPAVRPTRRQLQALRFVAQHMIERGFAPTLREIAQHMGIGSTNGVQDHLARLERKGFLLRDPMRSRAMRLTPAGFDILGIPRPHTDGVLSAPYLSVAPIVQVNEGWCCPRCRAQTFDGDKPCFLCALMKRERAA